MKHCRICLTGLATLLALSLLLPLSACRTTKAPTDTAAVDEPPDDTGSDTPTDPKGPDPKPKPPDKP